MIINQLIKLEWKSFLRNENFTQNIMFSLGKAYFGFNYLMVMMVFSVGGLFLFTEEGLPVKQSMFKYIIYLWAIDFVARYFFQKMPVAHIKPLMLQNIKKQTIVKYSLLKSAFSFFNIVNFFMFLGLYLSLQSLQFPAKESFTYSLSLFFIFLSNNFVIQLINHKKIFGSVVLFAFVLFGFAEYSSWFYVSDYTKDVFEFIYNNSFIPVAFFVILLISIRSCFVFYRNNITLESESLSNKTKFNHYEFSFLDRFGDLSPFLKLDLKLLTRNKRTRSVLFMSLGFLCYGLLFFTQEIYKDNTFFILLASIMITGGFMMLFGQYVPSWDSSYYPLMMTQNIPYRKYLEAKWMLMVVATLILSVLASFYLFFGLDIYLIVLAVAVYNIGWNCYLSLLTGVFVRSKIDLTSSKNAFGDKKAFNIHTIIISLPVILCPILIYSLFSWIFNENAALLALVFIGLCGLLFKNKIFNLIEKLYKQKKYETLKAYK